MIVNPKDSLMRTILREPDLIKFGEYSLDDYLDLDAALKSNNPVVSTVARIVDNLSPNCDVNKIYIEIFNHILL